MMYPFLQTADGTEIVHSEMLPDKTVKVYMETPDEKDCFRSAVCYLPEYRWEQVCGYSAEDVKRLQSVLESVAHLILEFSQHGGVENAAGF